MKLRAGELVEVRSKEEILRSLDGKGRLEELPFMPQMFQYCGQRFTVYKRAHKTCDTVNPVRGARISNSVHLDLRCDGAAYGGCQAACLIFWKAAWLKRVEGRKENVGESSRSKGPHKIPSAEGISITEADVWAGTQTRDPKSSDGRRYMCQATELPYFTTNLPWWDITQYMEDYISGNATLGRMFRGCVYAGYDNLVHAGIGVGRVLRWFYDRFQWLWGGVPYPNRTGTIPVGQPTPSWTLDLQPGELVRVRPYEDILATLNTEGRNRGLYFDAEMVPYCGGTYRVRTRLNRYINEKTGHLTTLKSAAAMLDGVWCQSRYSHCRMFCPRSIYSWWRETWLERVGEEPRNTQERRARR